MALCLFFLIAVNISFVLSAEGPSHGKKVVCYMHNWANYRKDLGQFSIEDIEPSLCTNIIYSFAALNETTHTIRSGDLWQDLETDYGKAGYRRVTALKDNYPHLKVTISLGGWSEGSAKYSAMASTPATRQTFIQSVLDFLKQHNFDGLDMHWKFPTLRDGKPYDKANYVLLLKELKEAFLPHNYLLTAAFGAGKSTMEAAYDLPKLNRHLDFMHLLAFDYHGAWDGSVGSNAPLRGIGQNDLNNLEFSVNYMISNGVAPGKIVLGLPCFGRTFELIDPGVQSIEFGKTRTKPVGFQGPFTAENGLMGYNEICMETSNKSSRWSHHWDDRSATAYIRDKERVICYDSGRSIAIKVKMAVDRGLGGLMVWSLDTDDFRGLCDGEVDPYTDFANRYNEMIANPRLPRAISSLGLPTAENAGVNDHYVTSNGRLTLRLPQRKPDNNFNLLRTVNDAASLATQEKRILEALPSTQSNEVKDEGISGFRSDYTYNPRVGYWLKLHLLPADWHTARLQCHYEGAVLASPLNTEIMGAMRKIAADAKQEILKNGLFVFDEKSPEFFTGVHQTFGDGMYTSVEGVPLEKLHIRKWDQTRLDKKKVPKREQCLVFYSDETVHDFDCGEKLPYLCYRKSCDSDRITECGTIDKAYKLDATTGHCYKLHTEPAIWDRAVLKCGAEGGHLAIANSADEASVLAKLASEARVPDSTVALGYRQWGQIDSWWTVLGGKLEESGWGKWCGGCPDYQRHPQRHASRQTCGGLKGGELDDIWCDVPYAFICEKTKDQLTRSTGAGCQSSDNLPFITC